MVHDDARGHAYVDDQPVDRTAAIMARVPPTGGGCGMRQTPQQLPPIGGGGPMFPPPAPTPLDQALAQAQQTLNTAPTMPIQQQLQQLQQSLQALVASVQASQQGPPRA